VTDEKRESHTQLFISILVSSENKFEQKKERKIIKRFRQHKRSGALFEKTHIVVCNLHCRSWRLIQSFTKKLTN